MELANEVEQKDSAKAPRHTVLFKTGSVIMKGFFPLKSMTFSIRESLLSSQP